MATRGERLKRARIDAGFRSAREAAASLGVGYSTYGSHENGYRNFEADEAIVYARKFKVTLEWLLTGKAGTNTSPEDEAISKALGKQPSELLPTRGVTMTDKAPTFEMRDVGKGRMLIRINQEVSWAKAMKIGAILSAAED